MSFWGLFPIFRGELAVSLVFFFQDVGAEGPFVACDGTLASPLGIRCFFFFLGGGISIPKTWVTSWWFESFCLIFAPKLGRMIQFDECCSNGLVQPPTRKG